MASPDRYPSGPAMPLTLAGGRITTPTLALGCARLGSALTPLGPRQCVALVAEAFDLGVRHFDTASIYGQGDSERFIGQALRGRRAQVCLSSKAGQRLTASQSLMARFKTPLRALAARRPAVHSQIAQTRAGGVPRCFTPDFIEDSLHASLERLATDHLDVFYLHSPNVEVLGDAALMDRIGQLREQGLFRAFGVSCDDFALAQAALRQPAVDVVQFAFDGSPAGHRLLADLAHVGKTAVLRGLMQTGAAQAPSNPHAADWLAERFSRTLGLPALGGLIVGTTNVVHLRANVAAFHRASQSLEVAA